MSATTTIAIPSSASQRPKPVPASGSSLEATTAGGATGAGLSGELEPASALGGADSGAGSGLGAANAADGSGGGTEEMRARGGGSDEMRLGGGGGADERAGGGTDPANGVALTDSASGGGELGVGGLGAGRPINVRERIGAG